MRCRLAVCAVLLACLPIPAQETQPSKDAAPDTKNLTRTEQWLSGQARKLLESRDNKFANEKIREETEAGLNGLKGEKVSWRFHVVSVEGRVKDGPNAGTVPINVQRESYPLKITFNESPMPHVNPDDWVATLRTGDFIVVEAVVSKAELKGRPTDDGVFASVTLRSITARKEK